MAATKGIFVFRRKAKNVEKELVQGLKPDSLPALRARKIAILHFFLGLGSAGFLGWSWELQLVFCLRGKLQFCLLHFSCALRAQKRVSQRTLPRGKRAQKHIF